MTWDQVKGEVQKVGDMLRSLQALGSIYSENMRPNLWIKGFVLLDP